MFYFARPRRVLEYCSFSWSTVVACIPPPLGSPCLNFKTYCIGRPSACCFYRQELVLSPRRVSYLRDFGQDALECGVVTGRRRFVQTYLLFRDNIYKINQSCALQREDPSFSFGYYHAHLAHRHAMFASPPRTHKALKLLKLPTNRFAFETLYQSSNSIPAYQPWTTILGLS